MKDCPQGLNSCANPATTAIHSDQRASVASTSAIVSIQLIPNQIEQAQGPA